MSTPTVLVVEDDETVRELVAYHLSSSGLHVIEAEDGEAGWARLDGVDAVVLDWMLPGESGLQWLQRLRAVHAHALPVLMLTARAREVDRVEGLERGADDYLVKPFSAAELVARVRALLRRAPPRGRIEVGPLVVDDTSARVTLHGSEVTLTRREYELLVFFVEHPGRVFSRTELLDHVWGEDFVGSERTVDQHVAQLRARLGAECIETVRGRGYRLADPSRTPGPGPAP